MAKTADLLKNIFFLLLLAQFAPALIHGIKKQYTRYFEPHTQVGYLPIKGIILNSSYYVHYLKKFFENKEIKAILLFIESPGGAAGSAEAIAHEIDVLKKEHHKPIITLTENILASGGYYIAAATDHIFTLPSTLVGSIGTVIPGQFKLNDFIEQFKIHYNVIKAGEYKSITDPFVPTTPEQNKLLQQVTQSSYENFVRHVSQHRPQLTIDSADRWADGKIFSGMQALHEGLIDSIGSKSNAIEKIKEMAIIEGKIEWIKPEQPLGIWNMLFKTPDYTENGESMVATMVNNVCAILEERYGTVKNLAL